VLVAIVLLMSSCFWHSPAGALLLRCCWSCDVLDVADVLKTFEILDVAYVL
jgi:hypothetical protein